MQKDKKIVIIGAGVSGLVCAIELEKEGYAPIIVEQSDRVGGRVRTNIKDGVPLDHGFQVLLTAYPNAHEYLDLKALDLRYFLSGSVILGQGKRDWIGDPLRSWALLWPTLRSDVGSLNDKLRILQLSNQLKRKTLQAIFAAEEVSTLDYLTGRGFSKAIIEAFFRPFFAGIFLEKELKTSSRMFEFVFKMFAMGKAAIPAKGIAAIPQQLRQRLSRTKVHLNTRVQEVSQHGITYTGGDTMMSDAIIVATKPEGVIKDYTSRLSWNSCVNLYFKANQSALNSPIIGLIPGSEGLINNLHFLSDVQPSAGHIILSVTVIGSPFANEAEGYASVLKELNALFPDIGFEPFGYFSIEKALPKMEMLSYAPEEVNVRWQEGIYLAGDHMANPSLNAAMEAGKVTAAAVLEDLR